MFRAHGKRLSIEPVDQANADLLWRLMSSPHLREFQDIPRFARPDFVKRVRERPRNIAAGATGRFEWLIFPRATAEAVGWVSLRIAERAPTQGEIGYSVLVQHRRQGYAVEAVQVMLESVFRSSDLEGVEAFALLANHGSRRLLAAAGFQQVEIQRAGALVRGRPVDVARYAMSRASWRLAEKDPGLATCTNVV